MGQIAVTRKFRLLTRAGLSFFRKLSISDDEMFSLFKRRFATVSELKRYLSAKSPVILGALLEARDETICYFRKNFPNAIRRTIEIADNIRCGKIELLNYTFTIDNGEIDWYLEPFSRTHFKRIYWRAVNSKAGTDILYTLELHKHQYLIYLAKTFWLTGDEEYVRMFISVLQDWINNNPLEIGPAYTSTLNVSQRIISWILSWSFLKDSQLFREDFVVEFIKSLYSQASFIKHNSTTHWKPRTNYFIAENVALLLVAVVLPELKESYEWLQASIKNLNTALKEQIWPDGISFEQSAGYQKLIIDFVILAVIVCEMNEIEFPTDIRDVIPRLLESLMNLGQPNGEVPHIGDISTESGFKLSAEDNLFDIRKYMVFGALLYKREDMKYMSKSFSEEAFWFFGESGAQEFAKLNGVAPKYKSKAFKEGGYFIMRSGWKEDSHYLVIDCGYSGLGRDGPGGHGHNDILHFTLSAWGKAFIIDAGTYMFFGSKDRRDYFRSTWAHNTVVIDNKEIAELGRGPFEIRGNAKPILNEWSSSEEYDFFSGTHTGYARLKDPVLHTRQILFVKKSYWIINDILEGKAKHNIEILLHFAPMPITMDKNTFYVKTKNAKGPNIMIIPAETRNIKGSIEEGWISNYYGIKERAPVLRYYCEPELPFEHKTIVFPLAEGEESSTERIKSDAIAEWEHYLMTTDHRL